MLRLDTFADLSCPWCYIAETRLDQVLAGHPDLALERHWQPFLLDPAAPLEGEAWSDFVVRKFGSHERAAALFTSVEDAGRSVGLTFRFGGMPYAPNTRTAHRVVLAAGDAGHAMAMRFFRAHFEEGENLSDEATLVRLAAELGVDATPVLTTDAYDADVDEALRAAQHLGLTGVPLFVFDRRLAVSGAQPTLVFEQALQQATQAGA